LDFSGLLRRNRNYRNLWLGQVVSETGDYFNNVAVLSLVMQAGGSGLVVSGVMLSRAIPAVAAGPIAGVVLDRLDRRRVMIASDLVRALVAFGFLFTVRHPEAWLLYVLSAVLMFASPFFSSGRAAILPTVAGARDLHAANSLTQTTQWATLTFGTMLAGWSVARYGYAFAFVINAASFLFSAAAMARVRDPGGFRARRENTGRSVRPWHEYREGLRYMASVPLILGIALITVGWATGGGAAQVLFALFGEQVFGRGAAGIGEIWGFAGLGLLVGGWLGHRLGRDASFRSYKRIVAASYILHGVTYILFAEMRVYWAALALIMLSRVGMAVSSVLNTSQLLKHTPDEYRGRVFATMETLRWAVMMFSMAGAGIASLHVGVRTLGVAAGVLGSLTGVYWSWADATGRLPDPGAAQRSTPPPSG
jgi:predicted MFS family arabinose efflux permease